MTKHRHYFAGALLVALGLIGLYPLATHAQSVDPLIGRGESVITISASVSASTALQAAVTGKQIAVISMHLNADTAGVYIFTDGDGGTTLAAVYLAANTDTQLADNVLGLGFKTTAGTGLYVDGPSSGVLRGVFRIRKQ